MQGTRALPLQLGMLLIAGFGSLAWQPGLTCQEVPLKSEPRLLCLRPAPSVCRSFPITELALNSAAYGTGFRAGEHLQWDLGAMVNLSDRYAVGASLSFGRPNDGHWGAQVRGRRWFGEQGGAVELGTGFAYLGGVYEPERIRATIDVTLVAGPWFGATAHASADREGVDAGGGARLTSWPGMIVGVLVYSFLAVIPAT